MDESRGENPPGEWVRGKGIEGKELSKGVSSDMI